MVGCSSLEWRTPYRIRTDDLRLERAVSWATRRTGREGSPWYPFSNSIPASPCGEMTDRGQLIAQVADSLCQDRRPHPLRVAVDGITASGKSTFAVELHREIADRGRRAIHLSMDGFHQPRSRRHRRGRDSAIGYYEDAYDLVALRELVLQPLGPRGNRRYRASIIDLVTDQPSDAVEIEAPADAVLIVDGTFLQRSELIAYWDHRIFLDVDVDEARARGIRRDSAAFGGAEEAERLFRQRYRAACALYLEEVHPRERATMVIDNRNVRSPALTVIR
jgi:uridine kinase